ncbi:MAG: hypothetical protein KGI02_01445 [Thaumarchaeota archaeon]|nr:hypothetical protein [Nitrososphaerota archaeon]MDE1831012.1 hypothetical protein [Nitrososphaerota archaeon]MDE1841837.1 hypothetical protein [Nitrososphaerota archaeon]MDE1877209.1 hypothetical protein [Nitrososphaerota archaeon]
MLTVPAFAQISVPKSLDHPGIKWDWKIKAENYTFDVITVSNYEMQNVTFNEMNKELVFLGNSTHDGNIAEIQIPTNLIGGKLTVTQDGKPVPSIVIPGTDSSTVMLKFNQTGTTNTSIIGTTYLPEFSNVALLVMVLSISMVLLIPRIKKF